MYGAHLYALPHSGYKVTFAYRSDAPFKFHLCLQKGDTVVPAFCRGVSFILTEQHNKKHDRIRAAESLTHSPNAGSVAMINIVHNTKFLVLHSQYKYLQPKKMQDLIRLVRERSKIASRVSERKIFPREEVREEESQRQLAVSKLPH